MENKNSAEFEQFKTKHKRLVYLHVRKLYAFNPKADFEDLLNAGFIGLWKAWEKFDPEKNNKFSTIAIPYIQGEIKNYLRDTSGLRSHFHEMLRSPDRPREDGVVRTVKLKKKTTDQFPVALAIAQPVTYGLFDRPPTDATDSLVEDPYGDVDNRMIIDDVMEQLTQDERAIIRLIFYEQESIVDIAKSRSTTEAVINRIRDKALAKFKVDLNIEDFEK